MKIGLIARCERWRGLAIQSKNFYDHMPVDKVLLVRMPEERLDCDERPEWYPGAIHAKYDARFHQLDRDVVEHFFEGLDVVFSVETPYDWRLPDWARERGVKTVVQGNPEFYRNDQPEFSHQADPDAWWWPTSWRIDRLPRGQIMPVPMPDMDKPTACMTYERIRFLHVVGKVAYGDRNGTDVVTGSLRMITEACDYTIHGVGWELPDINVPLGSQVNLRVDRVGVDDRWSMYRDHHVLVMPRRYGGLCLPALEAAACGLAVLMPDISPNSELASLFISGQYERPLRLAAGNIQITDVSQQDLGTLLNMLARNPAAVANAQMHSWRNCLRWSEGRQMYLDELERVCNQ